MMVSEDGFGTLTSELLALAHDFSKERILFTLEGGYDLQGLREGVKQVLLHLAGEAKKPEIEEKISAITLAKILERYPRACDRKITCRDLIYRKWGQAPFCFFYS
jgi:acetoin utilization deacetylase AcuC-like enzyme